MNKEQIEKIEKKLQEIFGERSAYVLTTAKAGLKGYMVRLECYGLPFSIIAHLRDREEAERLIVMEFEKRAEESLKSIAYPLKDFDEYEEEITLGEKDLESIYKYSDLDNSFDKDMKEEVKRETMAFIRKTESLEYECVITGKYKNLRAKGTSIRLDEAIKIAVWSATRIIKPEPVFVGNPTYK